MSHRACPDIGNWQSLLEDGSGGEASVELIAHLETCADCRQALETLAADPGAWEDAARGLEKRMRKEPALRGVLERLKSEELPAPDDDLAFLRPADKTGLLGMLGPYEVEEEIGRGGMGVVLKARDPALDRVVALKVLSPHLATSRAARRRFVREGRSAAAVCHEHIVTVYSVNEADGLPYLVMQYVAGESLQDRLDRAGPLELEDIARIGAQTASGLAAAHAHKLIHRDIKPANILLENRGAGSGGAVSGEKSSDRSALAAYRSPDRVKITDFGLARMTDDVQLTQNGVLAGTPEYMAPEQARGESVDHRADLFSLGSVLYAMCTGNPPFRALSALATLRQVSDETPTPVRQLNPGIHAWLEAIISKLMQKNPDRRFQQAAEVAGVLEGFMAHLRQPDTLAMPALEIGDAAASAIVANSPKRRRREPLIFAGLAMCISLLAFTLFLQDAPRNADAPIAQQAFAKEVYQDFRGKPPMLPEFRLEGPDLDAVTKSEEAGFRITLPKTRKANQPVQIAPTFIITGDFEITGTYELLAADMPRDGYGVGVSLNISTTNDLHKFLKISRVLRADANSVFMAEYWTQGADDWKGPQLETAVRSGQLRLVREGSTARCQVSEGPGTEFMTIFEKDDFGTEDIAYLRFQVTDGNKPGYAVDARLVDLRVRYGITGPTKVADPVAPAPLTPGKEERKAGFSGKLALMLLFSMTLTLLVAIGLGLFLHVRRRRVGRKNPQHDVHDAKPAAAHLVTFACTACGKSLKSKAALAGKKVKCPQCGKALVAPQPSRRAKARPIV
jgi:serine/threonine protein kinase/predicted RNA-binding Zn-ribbon protein involved in translation (DUF1610 family)